MVRRTRIAAVQARSARLAPALLILAAASTARAQAIGACCVASNCSITTQALCAGTYRGDFTDCQGGTPTTYSHSPNRAIPDDDCPINISDTITVPDAFSVTGVSVRVNIPDHTYISDLEIRLGHGGTTLVLMFNSCPGQEGLDITFDDLGGPLLCGTPTTGVFTPASAGGASLAAFTGSAAAGPWTLFACDDAFNDTGTLESWSLILRRAGPAPCAPVGPDCFTRSAPPVNGRYVRGGPNGVSDDTECVGDWDRNSVLTPSDVAAFVSTWFFSLQNPGNLDGDIDCNSQVVPSDVAYFVQKWFGPLQAPGTLGCP